MSRLRTALPVLGGFGAGMTFARRSRLASVAVRALSGRRSSSAGHAGIRVDLGPAVGEWSRPALVASLDHTLSDVVGRPVEGAAYSRFGEFEGRHPYSRFLDPDSPYYQAWLGAYVVLDGPDGAFAFSAGDCPRTEDALAVLEADQRLVYRSTGCPHRFDGGRCTRPVGSILLHPPREDGWWRLRGEADSWSNYCRGGGGSDIWGRTLYGVVPAADEHDVDDYHPLRYTGEFWIRHDDALRATCCAFMIAPRFADRSGREHFSGEALLAEVAERLSLVRFARG